MQDIYIITRNKGKLMAAQDAFSKYNMSLKQFDKDVPEIQADTSAEIALFAAQNVAKEFGINVIREDHSIFINALGIPGPYTNFIEKKLSAEKLLELLSTQNDRTGYFEVAAAYAEPNELTKTFIFQVNISFSAEPRGNLSGGWNRIIILEGENRTLAECNEKERVNVWNKNYIEIAKFLSERNKR